VQGSYHAPLWRQPSQSNARIATATLWAAAAELHCTLPGVGSVRAWSAECGRWVRRECCRKPCGIGEMKRCIHSSGRGLAAALYARVEESIDRQQHEDVSARDQVYLRASLRMHGACGDRAKGSAVCSAIRIILQQASPCATQSHDPCVTCDSQPW
jgi:hypothetical protein